METKTVGSKIASARKKMNISQAQLAERLFISAQAVGKWERGESMPDIITLNRLAEILGVDLNYFSGGGLATNGSTADEPSVKQATGSPSGDESKKLKWDMSRWNWSDADFSGLKDLHEKFSSSNMQRCKFIGSELSGLILEKNNVHSCDFSGSDFSRSHIEATNLHKNVFKDCSLKETEFSGSFVYGCDFTGANFTGVKMRSGGFEKNTLVNAVWERTSFIDTYLGDLVFDGRVENCYFDNCAFKSVTFQASTLTNTFFKIKRLKQLRFIDCQADRMTYELLKNGKANLSGITLLTT